VTQPVPAVVAVENLRKVYVVGDQQVVALDGVTVSVAPGEFVAVMGPSGSGKSTFMNIVGCLDRPTSGRYFFNGSDVAQLSADALADIRSRHLGFVFQTYNLLARTSALENVELPMVYAGVPQAARRTAALAALETVGLDGFAEHLSNQLSGGQQQRVAIARALVNNPSLMLADEPTGALDSKKSREVMELLTRLNEERKISILVVTHDPVVASFAHRLITFRDGRIESDGAAAQAVVV
jgi:putative ABC transport system ATP-binding protein